MGMTIEQVRNALTGFSGEQSQYADYISSPLLRHFKAGVNAAWRGERPNLETAEQAYGNKHGRAAEDAFTDGWVYSASYL